MFSQENVAENSKRAAPLSADAPSSLAPAVDPDLRRAEAVQANERGPTGATPPPAHLSPAPGFAPAPAQVPGQQRAELSKGRQEILLLLRPCTERSRLHGFLPEVAHNAAHDCARGVLEGTGEVDHQRAARPNRARAGRGRCWRKRATAVKYPFAPASAHSCRGGGSTRGIKASSTAKRAHKYSSSQTALRARPPR